jgi:hypothetical protein
MGRGRWVGRVGGDRDGKRERGRIRKGVGLGQVVRGIGDITWDGVRSGGVGLTITVWWCVQSACPYILSRCGWSVWLPGTWDLSAAYCGFSVGVGDGVGVGPTLGFLMAKDWAMFAVEALIDSTAALIISSPEWFEMSPECPEPDIKTKW